MAAAGAQKRGRHMDQPSKLTDPQKAEAPAAAGRGCHPCRTRPQLRRGEKHDDVQEDLHLDYKRSLALVKTDHCRAELSKDVSAFANADDGPIIYGIEESKDNHPVSIDEGINSNEMSGVWLEQTITSNIQPKINNFMVYPIPLPSKGPVIVWRMLSAYLKQPPEHHIRPEIRGDPAR
jgi:Putative DNA-binding domain